MTLKNADSVRYAYIFYLAVLSKKGNMTFCETSLLIAKMDKQEDVGISVPALTLLVSCLCGLV